MPRQKMDPGTRATLDAIEGVGRAAAGRPPPAKTWRDPRIAPGLGSVTETVVPETGFSIDAEFAKLEKLLHVEGALTPQVVREHLNQAESRAMMAHRIYVVAKLEFSRYEIDCNEALGAMRDEATADLQREKAKGERSKQITDADVRARASILYPDEWASISGGLERARRAVQQLEHFADLWKGRRFSLAALLGGGGDR